MSRVARISFQKKFTLECAKWRMVIFTLIAQTWLMSPGVMAQAVEPADSLATPSAFTFRGFGTLGLARLTGGDVSYLRDISQPEGIGSDWTAKNDSIFGVQANYRVAKNVDTAVQVVSHYRYDGSYSPELTWAYLKYEPTPSLTFRFGRIGTEFLINSDSGKIGYSYLPVRPSPEYFGVLIVNYGDGADAQYRYPLGDGIFEAKVFAGVAREKMFIASLDGSSLIKGALGYRIGDWHFKYIHSQIGFANDIPMINGLRASLSAAGADQASNALGLDGKDVRYQSLGVAYDDGTWQFQGFAQYLKHDYVAFENAKAAYVLLARRFGRFTPYIGYARAKTSSKQLDTGLPDPAYDALNTGVANFMTVARVNHRSQTVGVRWDFAKNMSLKAQVDLLRGDKTSNGLFDSTHSFGWGGKGKVFSLAFDFIF